MISGDRRRTDSCCTLIAPRFSRDQSIQACVGTNPTLERITSGSCSLFGNDGSFRTYVLTNFALAAGGPPTQILIAGDPPSPDTRELLRQVNTRFLPNKILLVADGGAGQQQLTRWLPFVARCSSRGGRATAYICEKYVCKQPTTDARVVAQLLSGKKLERYSTGRARWNRVRHRRAVSGEVSGSRRRKPYKDADTREDRRSVSKVRSSSRSPLP